MSGVASIPGSPPATEETVKALLRCLCGEAPAPDCTMFVDMPGPAAVPLDPVAGDIGKRSCPFVDATAPTGIAHAEERTEPFYDAGMHTPPKSVHCKPMRLVATHP